MKFKDFFLEANLSDKRDTTIDIVRGVAIFIMIAANMAPVLANQPSYWVRALYSCAAPIFITLSGVMIARSILKSSPNGFIYFLERGFFLIAVGALVDMVAYHYVPFLNVDVLYLFGISAPILFLIAKSSTPVVAGIAVLIFATTFTLQNIFGYNENLALVHLGQHFQIDPIVVMKHWIIDGWFPVFPWLGYGATGILFGRIRWDCNSGFRRFDRPILFLSALSVFFIGITVMNFFPGEQYVRVGYQELFYPVTPGFLLWSLAMIFCLIGVVDATGRLTLWRIVQPLGEASLFVYLAHSIIIGKIYAPFFSPMNNQSHLMFFLALYSAMFLATSWLRGVRKIYRNMPTKLRWVVG